MVDNITKAFERLIYVIKDPEVEGNWRRFHGQQVADLRYLFDEFQADHTKLGNIYSIIGKADRLISNLAEKKQGTAATELTELKFYADQFTGQQRKGTKQAAVSADGGEIEPTKWWKHDVVVVCALHDPELQTFLDSLGKYEEHVGQIGGLLSGWTYYSAQLPLARDSTESISIVALALDKTGMVDCAALTVECIRSFSPRIVAMTGVCAGRGSMGVKIGDLIIPSGVFTSDTGKYVDNSFLREPRWSSTGHAVMQRVKVRADEILREIADEFKKFYGETSDVSFFTDIMACGSAVVDSKGLLDEIAQTHRKVVGLDMESYALLRAVELIDQRISGLIVKGVMDLSTEKRDTHKRVASLWAARFLVKFLAYEFPMLVGYETVH